MTTSSGRSASAASCTTTASFGAPAAISTRVAPSAERKLGQARRGLSLARLVLEGGDVEAAREQCRAALTTIARWLLIANGEFPLSRNELSDQLLTLGCFDLAAALQRLIHYEPSREELHTGLELAEKLMGTPQELS